MSIFLASQRPQVVWLVARESLKLAAWGLLLGAPLLVLATRLLGSMLWKLSPYDPVSIGAAVSGVLLVIAIASLVPAQRAASVYPVRSLRSE